MWRMIRTRHWVGGGFSRQKAYSSSRQLIREIIDINDDMHPKNHINHDLHGYVYLMESSESSEISVYMLSSHQQLRRISPHFLGIPDDPGLAGSQLLC